MSEQILKYGDIIAIGFGVLAIVAAVLFSYLRTKSAPQEASTATDKKDEPMPTVGQTIGFPDFPYPATLEIEKIDEDEERIYAIVTVNLPIGTKLLGINRAADDGYWMAECGFYIVFFDPTTRSGQTWTWEWLTDKQPTLQGYQILIKEIRVQES